jgi:WD40 repeat protein
MINTMHRSMLSSTDRNSDGDNPIMKQLKRTIICIWLCAVLSACVPATSQPASDASFNEEAVTVLTVTSEMTPAAIQVSPTSSAPSTVEGSVLPTSLPSPSAALITPTSAMSTPTPAADDGGIDFFDFCDMPQIIPPGAGEDPDELFFEAVDGWYRTADEFATSEWIAPEGYLSRDLRYLVTVDCQGVGTICVASPPTAEPKLLGVRYHHDYDPDKPKTLPGNDAFWMPDNKRLILGVGYVVNDVRWDSRLYLLNLETEELTELVYDVGGGLSHSPEGNCIATIAADQTGTRRFQIIALDEDGVRDVWFAPDAEPGTVGWPDLSDDIAWSPDGKLIAYSHLNDDFRIWNLVTGERESYPICRQCPAYVLRWSPDGDYLYINSGMNLIYSLGKRELMQVSGDGGATTNRSYQWMPESRSIILPNPIYGSQMFSLDNETLTQLYYPGQETGWSIIDLFWRQ